MVHWPGSFGGGMSYVFRSAWVWGLTAGVLVVLTAGLCPEQAPSNPAKAKLAMILVVDFIMRWNEVDTGLV